MTRTLPKLARLELQILEILWSRGQASVREVQEGFPEPRPASTTVQTTMYRLEGKGAVRRTRKIGNAHIFEPLVARDPESRFEVVSIRPADPSAQLRLGMTPGRLDLVGAPVRMVVAMVFPVQRVSGWPDGIDAERYTISAKMPDGASLAARQVAIRNLLKDRFELVTHTQTREVPVWGLTGIYDFTLEWTPEAGLSTPSALGLPPDPQPPADPDAPGIFTALQEQLGLKLESGRAPLSIRRD